MIGNVSTSPVFVNVAPQGKNPEYVRANDIVAIQKKPNEEGKYNAVVRVEQIKNGVSQGVRYEDNELSQEVVSKLNLIG